MGDPAAPGVAGVVLDRRDVRILDTRELAWSHTAGPIPATTKTLSVDDDGDGIIEMRWLPSYQGPTHARDGGFRLATEYYFLLGEEFTHWEIDPDLGDELVRLRRGFWMDRRAGNLTSGLVEMPVGSRALEWIIADEDPFAGTLTAAGLTLGSPFAPDPAALVLDRPLVSVLDTRDARWERHPAIAGAAVKVLSATAAGDIGVELLALPPGPFPTAAAAERHSSAFREFALVLEGECHQRVFEAGDGGGRLIAMREGFWLDRRPGSPYAWVDGGACGAVLLQFRTRPDVEFVKTRDKYVRWSRTRASSTNILGSPPATEAERRELIAQRDASRAARARERP